MTRYDLGRAAAGHRKNLGVGELAGVDDQRDAGVGGEDPFHAGVGPGQPPEGAALPEEPHGPDLGPLRGDACDEGAGEELFDIHQAAFRSGAEIVWLELAGGAGEARVAWGRQVTFFRGVTRGGRIALT